MLFRSSVVVSAFEHEWLPSAEVSVVVTVSVAATSAAESVVADWVKAGPVSEKTKARESRKAISPRAWSDPLRGEPDRVPDIASASLSATSRRPAWL